MTDGVIKNNGTSRMIKGTLPATYDAFRTAVAAGTQGLDVLFNEDGWSQIPTFLNKANLLSANTCDNLNILDSSVVSDAFDALSYLRQSIWQHESSDYTIYTGVSQNQTFARGYGYGSDWPTIQYADGITQTNGELSLVGTTTTIEITPNNYSTAFSGLAGKYMEVTHSNSSAQIGNFYRIDGTTITTDTGAYNTYFSAKLAQVFVFAPNTIERFFNQADAFTDGQDGYSLISSVQDSILWGAKIQFGSYAGTGAYGISNPNTLTFNFYPQIIFLGGGGNSVYGGISPIGGDSVFAQILIYQNPGSYRDINSNVVCNINGKTFTYYSTLGASEQFNAAGSSYFYVGIF